MLLLKLDVKKTLPKQGVGWLLLSVLTNLCLEAFDSLRLMMTAVNLIVMPWPNNSSTNVWNDPWVDHMADIRSSDQYGRRWLRPL